MPKPKDKTELLQLSQANFQKLYHYVNDLTEEEQLQEFPIGTLNRTIRDVFAHLHHWHLLLLNWYETGMKGEKPDMPAKGYTWKTTPELNKAIWQQYQQASFSTIREELMSSFKQVQKIIEKHSQEELFEKKRYKWTGSTSLGVYLISNTSSHYNWAYKLIKAALKEKK